MARSATSPPARLREEAYVPIDGRHIVTLGKALYGVGGFDLVGLVVDDDQFDGAAEDGGRDLVRKLDAFKFKLPGEGVLSGQRHVDADLDGIFRFGGGGEPHAQSHTGKRAQKSAEFHASILQL